VLAGRVVGQLTNSAAAPHIRAGRLVPLLLHHLSEHIDVHVCYGSRAALPGRVRAFVELAVERLMDCPACILSAKDLPLAAALVAHAVASLTNGSRVLGHLFSGQPRGRRRAGPATTRPSAGRAAPEGSGTAVTAPGAIRSSAQSPVRRVPSTWMNVKWGPSGEPAHRAV